MEEATALIATAADNSQWMHTVTLQLNSGKTEHLLTLEHAHAFPIITYKEIIRKYLNQPVEESLVHIFYKP